MLFWIGSIVLILIIIGAIIWSRFSEESGRSGSSRPGSNRTENSISDTLKKKLKGC